MVPAGAPLDDQRHRQHRPQVKVRDRERLAKPVVTGGVDRDDRLAAGGSLPRDRARQRQLVGLQRPLVDVPGGLDLQLAGVVLQQQEPALGVGQLDHGVEDHLQQPRQSQLAVEALVDAEKAPQSRLGGLRAGGQRSSPAGAPPGDSQTVSGSSASVAR